MIIKELIEKLRTSPHQLEEKTIEDIIKVLEKYDELKWDYPLEEDCFIKKGMFNAAIAYIRSGKGKKNAQRPKK